MLISGGHCRVYEPEIHTTLRYPDGCCISQHPKDDEIHAHRYFWLSECSKEQAEVVGAIRDMRVMRLYRDGPPPLQQLSLSEAVERILHLWPMYYPWEVRDFFTYIQAMNQNLTHRGFDATRTFKLSGAVPTTVRHMLKLWHPSCVVSMEGEKEPKGFTEFFRQCKKARIGGG